MVSSYKEFLILGFVVAIFDSRVAREAGFEHCLVGLTRLRSQHQSQRAVTVPIANEDSLRKSTAESPRYSSWHKWCRNDSPRRRIWIWRKPNRPIGVGYEMASLR